MRTSVRALIVLGALALGAGPAAHAAEARDALGAFLKGVSIRFGVARESLVVLPIVLDGEPAPGGAKLSEPDGVAWRRASALTSLVELTAEAGTPPHQRFLADGTILEGGDRERLLARPVPLIDDEHALAASAVCDSRKAPAQPVGPMRPGAVAPLEQRKLMAADNAERLLPMLQRIQACLAGTPPETDTVAAVLASAKTAAGVRDRLTALEPLLKACAGRTVGHVAFFGFRPVEVVAFARPDQYQACGRASLRALAASHFFWSEVNAPSPTAPTDDEMRRLMGEATALLRAMDRMHGHEVRPELGERCRWRLFAGDATTDAKTSGRTEKFACQFALDESDAFARVTAIESGPETLYPQPYSGPGGRPIGEPPDNKGGGGGLSIEALQRMLERLLQNRERARGQNH